MINISGTAKEVMGLIFEIKGITRNELPIIKLTGKKKTIKGILMVLGILELHMKGRIGEMPKGGKNL